MAASTSLYGADAALVVVDVQNDFAHPAGSLAVPGGEEVVAAVNEEVRAARAQGALVVYTQDWHPERTPHFAVDGGIWPVHCVQGTWGADLHASLLVAGPVVHKGVSGEDGYSGFTMHHHESGEDRPTGLEALLRAAGVRRLVVVGLATDYCVKATGLDARRLGFPTTVLRRAVAAVDLRPRDGEVALAELAAAGATVV
jgi:nicotinamidase/pyrazinamidase